MGKQGTFHEHVRTEPTSTKGGQPGQNACQQTAKEDSLYSVPLHLNILSKRTMAVVEKTVWEFAKLIQLSKRQ